MDINNAQLIQINDKPFWQASGVNVEGKQLALKQNNKLGLWQARCKSPQIVPATPTTSALKQL
ncbi:hypothetical protein JCM19238_401 [Vibrio ponticus]|nr:hypothetical protein JCM19238_401 [Vibrio ponticus]